MEEMDEDQQYANQRTKKLMVSFVVDMNQKICNWQKIKYEEWKKLDENKLEEELLKTQQQLREEEQSFSSNQKKWEIIMDTNRKEMKQFSKTLLALKTGPIQDIEKLIFYKDDLPEVEKQIQNFISTSKYSREKCIKILLITSWNYEEAKEI